MTDQVHILIDKQTEAKAKSSHALLIFKKAFNLIWHDGLLYKLMGSGVGGTTYNILKSMYTSNKQQLKLAINTQISSLIAVG